MTFIYCFVYQKLFYVGLTQDETVVSARASKLNKSPTDNDWGGCKIPGTENCSSADILLPEIAFTNRKVAI